MTASSGAGSYTRPWGLDITTLAHLQHRRLLRSVDAKTNAKDRERGALQESRDQGGVDDYRGISRALAVLTALNRSNGSSVTEISRLTGISRPALYRILTVLTETGYLRRRMEDRAYILTSKVKTLSDGFRSETWINEIASPVLDALQRKVVWPTDLAMFRGNRLELLETTRRQSPFVIDQLVAGGELSSVFKTALGLAYLSYAHPSERAAIIAFYASQDNTTDATFARDAELLQQIFKRVTDQGYAWRYGGSVKETGTIAVPVIRGEFAVASVGITFIASALSVEEAVKRYMSILKQSARDIEGGLESLPLHQSLDVQCSVSRSMSPEGSAILSP